MSNFQSNIRINLNKIHSSIISKDFKGNLTKHNNLRIYIYYNDDIQKHFSELEAMDSKSNILLCVDVSDLNIGWKFKLIDNSSNNNKNLKSSSSSPSSSTSLMSSQSTEKNNNGNLKLAPPSPPSSPQRNNDDNIDLLGDIGDFDDINVNNVNNELLLDVNVLKNTFPESRTSNVNQKFISNKINSSKLDEKKMFFHKNKNNSWYIKKGPRELTIQIDTGVLLSTKTKSFLMNYTFNNLSFLANEVESFLLSKKILNDTNNNSNSSTSSSSSKKIKKGEKTDMKHFITMQSNMGNIFFFVNISSDINISIEYVSILLSSNIFENVAPENIQ